MRRGKRFEATEILTVDLALSVDYRMLIMGLFAHLTVSKLSCII